MVGDMCTQPGRVSAGTRVLRSPGAALYPLDRGLCSQTLLPLQAAALWIFHVGANICGIPRFSVTTEIQQNYSNEKQDFLKRHMV